MNTTFKFIVHGTVFSFRVLWILLSTALGFFFALFSGHHSEEVDPDGVGGGHYGFTNDLSATNNWRDPRDFDKGEWNRS